MPVLYNLCQKIDPLPIASLPDGVPVYMNGLPQGHDISPRGPDTSRPQLAQAAVVLRIADADWREEFEAGDAPDRVTISATLYLPFSPCKPGMTPPPLDTLDLLLPLLSKIEQAGVNYDPPVFADIDVVDAIAVGVDAVVDISVVYSELVNATAG